MLIQALVFALQMVPPPQPQATKPVAPPATETKSSIKTPRQVAKAVQHKATARCKDDSYSFKKTDNPCAHHGGVAQWLNK